MKILWFTVLILGVISEEHYGYGEEYGGSDYGYYNSSTSYYNEGPTQVSYTPLEKKLAESGHTIIPYM